MREIWEFNSSAEDGEHFDYMLCYFFNEAEIPSVRKKILHMLQPSDAEIDAFFNSPEEMAKADLLNVDNEENFGYIGHYDPCFR